MGTDGKRAKNRKNDPIRKQVRRYGADILSSEAFGRASTQTHHLYGTVSDHTLRVCTAGMVLARLLEKTGVRVNEKDLIEASLCHDLGMVDRDEKYEGRTEAWKAHPEESLKIARELVPDLSENAESLILSHMWPVSGPAPRSREAVILNIADKVGSLADWTDLLIRRFR